MKAPVLITVLLLGFDTFAAVPASAQAGIMDGRKAIDPIGLILPPAFATDKRDSERTGAVLPPMVLVDAEAGRFGPGALRDRPIALAAAPLDPPPAVSFPALPKIDLSHALAIHLREPWQRIAFIGGLVVLAAMLFWWLGTRARRHEPRATAPAEHVPAADAQGYPKPPRARYATLHEALAAMKAEAARS